MQKNTKAFTVYFKQYNRAYSHILFNNDVLYIYIYNNQLLTNNFYYFYEIRTNNYFNALSPTKEPTNFSVKNKMSKDIKPRVWQKMWN